MYKKNFLLCAIAGSLVFSHFNSACASTALVDHPNINLTEGENVLVGNVRIRDRMFPVSVTGPNSVLKIINGDITSEGALLNTANGAQINAKKINAKTIITGLQTSNSTINLEDSIITVKGNHESHGIVFQTGRTETPSEATLINTKLLVSDGVGILPLASGNIRLKNSKIVADVLLKNKVPIIPTIPANPVTLILTADRSILEGRVRTLENNTTIFNLKNNSKWFVKSSQNEIDNDLVLFGYSLLDISQRTHSTVSVLNLENSTIIFKEPIENHYQTLSVGSAQQRNSGQNTAEIYNAKGNTTIHFNVEWSDGLEKTEQKTDRLLIHGNVSGNTTIHLNNPLKSDKQEANDIAPSNVRGLSLVQISGKANEGSFKLANGYATMSGLPYKYILSAYGPTSKRGKANVEQSFLEENDSFWDFRLQNAYIDPEKKVRALVPQIASYLVMPNVIFSSGFADVNNQNILLSNMRNAVSETENSKKKNISEIFFSSYGNMETLSSSRNAKQYGYGADINYTALQAGITLATLEGKNAITNFGFLSTYGKLSFIPLGMEDSKKNAFNKWSITAYGSVQYNDSVYINTLLSYGRVDGNITTAIKKNTAKLENAKTLSISATISKKLAIDTNGLVFEPKAQFVYQRLALGTLSDIDGFKVDIGNPYRVLLNIGGRLTKTVNKTEQGRDISLYGKLNITKAFGDNNETIKIADAFYIDQIGTSIEGGAGISAYLSKNITLYGDVSYQHKLQKSGISGTNFSSGIRYRF
ncbi:autotransporter outer membrane beta-barrel domain-containing protein [Bartonella sp. B41]